MIDANEFYNKVSKETARNLRHFLRLAKRGAFGGASGGEVRAHNLAHAVLNDCCGLDQDAMKGFNTFASIAHASVLVASSLFDDDDDQDAGAEVAAPR